MDNRPIGVLVTVGILTVIGVVVPLWMEACSLHPFPAHPVGPLDTQKILDNVQRAGTKPTTRPNHGLLFLRAVARKPNSGSPYARGTIVIFVIAINPITPDNPKTPPRRDSSARGEWDCSAPARW